MIIISFFIILALTIEITNRKNGAQNSEEILDFGKNGSLIVLLCIVASFIVEFVAKNFLKDFYYVILFIASGIFLMILIIMNINREALIKKKHTQIVNTFQALTDIFGRVEIEDIDFENIPFQLEEDPKTGNVNKIIIDTSVHGCKANENTIILAQYSINKFFPELQWTSLVDYPKRELIFKGLPKPPNIAMYPGSDYRPTGWIPLGLSGEGEIGWNIADPKSDQMGTSSYVNEEGKIPDPVNMPSAPQCLTLGSTGGGKSIWVNQIIEVKS